jgi:hypothetical protein
MEGQNMISENVSRETLDVRSKLATILEELEAQAHQSGGVVYRRLHHGLVLRLEERQDGYQLAIAREWPSIPSIHEENVVLRDLAPLFAGGWHRTQKRRGNDGRCYNVSTIDYHR